MNEKETEYLNKLFASSSDITDEAEVEVPLVNAPNSLNEKLYRIADSNSVGVIPIKRRYFGSWPQMARIAAGVLVGFMAFQFYQQQQTLNQLEKAQADLAVALHYLGEANRITRQQVRSSLNENIKKAGVEPALEIGRDSLLPALRSNEPQSLKTTRTL